MLTNSPAFTQGLVVSKVEAEGFFSQWEDGSMDRSVVYVVKPRAAQIIVITRSAHVVLGGKELEVK